MFKIYPYKVGSASVRKLKEALSALIIKTEGSKYRYKDTDLVINWGNSHRSDVLEGVPVLNEPEAVALATNKLMTFEALDDADVSHVPYTTSREQAQGWLNEGHKVFIRDSLTGHSGEGIVVVEPQVNSEQLFAIQEAQRLLDNAGLNEVSDALDEDYQRVAENNVELREAPLYTRGVVNSGEYRVHVFDGDVILYQKKSRRVNEETGEVITAEGEEADVRNLASNWIYRTGNLRRLERVEDLARNAVSALGLDFGAVDIIMDPSGDVYVLEVNSAPGISNTETADAYINAFNSLTE